MLAAGGCATTTPLSVHTHAPNSATREAALTTHASRPARGLSCAASKSDFPSRDAHSGAK